MGADIADVLIRWILNRKSRFGTKEQESLLQSSTQTIRYAEVMKYISPDMG
jgi:hypothetical protein